MTNETKQANQQPTAMFNADAYCDFGGRGCAEGPMEEIAMHMRRLQPGQTLELRATHASVLADLGPWTRMTGNKIIKRQDNHYLLERAG